MGLLNSSLLHRPLAFLCLPDDIINIVEDYAEVEVAVQLKREFEALKTEIFAKNVNCHKSFDEIEGILQPHRFKILLHTHRFKVDLSKFFAVSIKWEKTVPACLPWMGEGPSQNSKIPTTLTAEETALSVLDFIDHCRNFPILAVKELFRGFRETPVKDVVKSIENFLESTKNQPESGDAKKVLQITLELIELIDLATASDKTIYLPKVEKFVEENPAYISLIGIICFFPPFSTNNYAKFEPAVREIILFILQNDFENLTPLHKGKFLAELLNNKPGLKTLTDLRDFLKSEIKLAGLVSSTSLHVHFKEDTLIDYLTTACLDKWTNCNPDDSRIASYKEELSFLAHHGASHIKIARLLNSRFDSKYLKCIFLCLESAKLRITLKDLIEALPSPKISVNLLFINFLRLSNFLLRFTQTTKSEQNILMELLKPATKASKLKKSDPLHDVKHNQAIQNSIANIEKTLREIELKKSDELIGQK